MPSAEPSATTASARRNPASGDSAAPPRWIIQPARISESSRKSSLSAGRFPLSRSTDSTSSIQLPATDPSGCPISVISATVRVPAASAVATISAARYSASSRLRRKAPDPVFTSSTSASRPAASFLLKIEAQINPGLSTVPVRSRSAYSTRSAGTRAGVWLTIEAPHFRKTASNSSSVRAVRYPGIASSLSSVPPVCPSARPLIIGTATPQAAAIGATRKLVLSPTPPVECLSTATFPKREGSNFTPESRIATVRARISSSSNPFSHAAINHAESCSAGILSFAAP